MHDKQPPLRTQYLGGGCFMLFYGCEQITNKVTFQKMYTSQKFEKQRKTIPKGVETEGPVCIFSEGKNKGVAAIELSASNSPPDGHMICQGLFSRLHRAKGPLV